ncbi:unnamed protein product [Urochloa decumbens]|uniref:KIB1-4 beta-propeller domain-containing protein n=1 Tax=Urochloa decumbens TaxID=240449 RepID=A0ABC9ESR6_9POAL
MEKLMIPIRRSNRLSGSSGSQIPFRRAAALHDSRRPCSSTQIQSQGAKRKHLSSCASWGAKRARSALRSGGDGDKQALSGRSLPPPPHTNNRCVHLIHFLLAPSWGAKRARSALGCGCPPAVSIRSLGSGGGNPALSVGSLPCPDNSSICADWANIGDGPAGRIAELALASDVADYARFRTACRSWRRCSPDPCAGGLDGRFLPRRWIMLDKALAGPRRRRFLNISTGECVRMDLPVVDEHTLLALTPEGLLLLLHEPTLVVRLLNPLTYQLTDLPPVTGLLRLEEHRARSCGIELGQVLKVYSTGLVADGAAIAVHFGCPRVLAVAKPGDESWTPVEVDDTYMNSALPFAGRFYCASYRGVMVLSLSSDQRPPRLLMVAERCKSFFFCIVTDSLHLVDNGGELMLIHRTLYCENDQDQEEDDSGNDQDQEEFEENDDAECMREYEVYRVNLDAGILTPVKSLNGRAIFMGISRTISISADAFPSVTPNTIYLGYECDREIRGYNIADGSVEPLHYSSLGPDCAVDCLRYCIQSVGTDFA